MKLLLFSDLQLDASETNTQRGRDAFSYLCGLAAQLHVDALCCAGNLYDDRSASVETLEFLATELERIPQIKAIFAPGSTDWYHQGCGYDHISDLPNVHVFTQPRLIGHPVGDAIIWGAAHVAPHQPTGFFDGFTATPADAVQVALFYGHEVNAYAADQSPRRPYPVTAPFQAAQAARAGITHVFAGGLSARTDDRVTYASGGGAVSAVVRPDGTVERRFWHDPSGPAEAAGRLLPAEEPEEAWLTDILDGQEPDLATFDGQATMLARFVTDVDTSHAADRNLRRAVLRAGIRGAREGARHSDAD